MDFIITFNHFYNFTYCHFIFISFFYRIQNQITQILESQHNELISQLDNLKNIEQQGLTIFYKVLI
jgi:hypothetical protein